MEEVMKLYLKTLTSMVLVGLLVTACSRNEQPIVIDQTPISAPPSQHVQNMQNPQPDSAVATQNNTVDNAVNNAVPQITTVATDQMQSIKNAILVAQNQTKGYATDFEIQGGHLGSVYEIETFNGRLEHKVLVDAKSGQVLFSRAEREFKRKGQPAISLDKAIEIAQQSVAGQVFDASLDREYIGSHYEVKVIGADGQPHEVVVDAQTGQVLQSFVDYDD